MKPMLLAAQYASTRFTAAVHEVVAVLHRRHRKYPPSGFDVGHRDFAQPRMANDAVVQQSAHGAELFVARYSRIGSMELPEIDLLDAEACAASQALAPRSEGAPQMPGPVRRIAP